MVEFKYRLYELMTYYNVTQADISKKTGLTRSAISLYLSGQRSPKQDAVYKIAQAYGVDVGWLSGADVPMLGNKHKESVEQKPKAIVKQKITKSETSVDALGDAMDYVVLGKAIGENIDVVVSLSKLNKDNQDKVRKYLKLLISQQDMEEDV